MRIRRPVAAMGTRDAQRVVAGSTCRRCCPRCVVSSDAHAGGVSQATAHACLSRRRCSWRRCVSAAGSGTVDVMNPIDTSVFVSKFVEEARDRITALGAALLQLEATPGSAEAIAHALRESHSIKGSALMLG